MPFIFSFRKLAAFSVTLTVAPPVIAAWIARPGALSIITAGMLREPAFAVPPMTVFGFAFVYISTPVAPAAAAFASFTEKSQLPRASSAILPAIAPGFVSATQASTGSPSARSLVIGPVSCRDLEIALSSAP